MSETFNCYIMGTESLLIQCAEILQERGHQIEGIITDEQSIAEWALSQKLSIIPPGRDLAARLAPTPFDYFFSITNLSIVPDEVLALAGKGAINFHDGPLPKYAGLHATTWALLNQEEEHGVTWHEMGTTVDTGDILKQKSVPIAPGETAFTLNAKCYEAGMASFPELVDELAAGSVQRIPQNPDEITYFGKFKRPPAAATIDFSRSAAEIDALVRALDFGPYTNPLALPKLRLDDAVYAVPQVTVLETTTRALPGAITAVSPDQIEVATATKSIAFTELRELEGTAVSLSEIIARHNLEIGTRLPSLDDEAVESLSALNEALARHESFWVKRLGDLSGVEMPYADRTVEPAHDYGLASFTLPDDLSGDAEYLLAAFVAYLARLSGDEAFDLGFTHDLMREEVAQFAPYFAAHVPLHVSIDFAAPASKTMDELQGAVATTRKRRTYARDAVARYPDVKAPHYPILTAQVSDFAAYTAVPGTELAFLVDPEGKTCGWVHDTVVYSRDVIETIRDQFLIFLGKLAAAGENSLAEIHLLDETAYRQIMETWNETDTPYSDNFCIHQLFQVQAAKTPTETAVVFENESITYQELNARANQVAHHLRQLSVGPETRVGIFMDRSLEMVVSLLGILKAGAAYLPLDPTYPADRLAFMVEDAAVPVILTQSKLVEDLPPHHARIIQVDADWPAIAKQATDNVHSGVTPQNLAYLIYTSGSTGKPKGVMVQHGNAVNFFAGMDQRIPHDPPGTWLAVTSLSFDISVLELFWTLSRGFEVILYADRSRDNTTIAAADPHAQQEIDFSLFYFASDESEEGVADKYNLLLEGAKFADRNGFSAVWTPERHFHAFGGLYPNPSVAGAALAVITENVRIRSGSCVLPLHSPVRVAEEWSLVDNLSKGRVDISFASGWQPNDFVLMPQNYANRKEVMFENIEVVQKLWRGETVSLPGPKGEDVDVQTLPRPIQSELPIWITAAGNPETFRMAGQRGFNVLTHLLGQSVAELAEKIEIYQQGWQEGGHPGRGHVSLMLHTFIGDDDDEVREIVRKPMTDYLRSALGLVRKAAWYFPTFKQKAEATGQTPLQVFESEDLSDDDLEALLHFAFERYFETSGLFGTPATAMKMVRKLKAIDVDEIACLIDFGVPSATVLDQLHMLDKVREMAQPQPDAADYSIPALIERHDVTHFQCTPSMARMLLVDEWNHEALGSLQNMMVGGESLPRALARDLKALGVDNLINMYGPTETTVWSSTCTIQGDEEAISIGRPIANTQLYIVDRFMQPTPVGVAGELLIGGDGVVRGYLNRPELTAERFIEDPFSDDPEARLYRTGDLARYRPDGYIDFLGRADFQVKIRGFRIELGEIESVLQGETAVAEAVVVAREDAPGDKRLVAYLIAAPGQTISTGRLRDSLRETLPEFMIPSHFVVMDKFPLTPNKKTDRKALPAPDEAAVPAETSYAPPDNELEQTIAEIWKELLGVPQVGMNDNFFDLGGHSLLTVQAHRRLRDVVEQELAVTDLFRFPTIRSLADFLSGDQENGQGESEEDRVQQSMDRAETRRAAMARRRNRRQRRNR